MEVYQQQFSSDLQPKTSILAEIIDADSFDDLLVETTMVFLGDGAAKCKEVINHPNAVFLEDFKPSARGMFQIAESKHTAKDFEDVAYFEPYYLKDFVAGKPRRVF
jgi:tRNA threonylcarbamoyladenosine biosynthesis protein TsaB